MRVSNRWRFRRRAAGILLNLCKANAGLHWHPIRRVGQRAVRTAAILAGWARARVVHGLRPKDSFPARIATALLEEEGVLEACTKVLFRVIRFICALVRKWPWAHTATAVAAYTAASRTQARGPGGTPAPLAGLLEYVPTFARNFTVIATAPE